MLNSAKTNVGIGLPIEETTGTVSSDLLVESILYIAKHHGRTLSATSLLSGLPLDAEGRLTPRLAEVAARKAGFAARIVKSSLGRIASFALPAVLFLREDAACVLLDVRDGECHVAHPSVEGGEQVMTQEDLARIYAGFVMYLVPEENGTSDGAGGRQAEQTLAAGRPAQKLVAVFTGAHRGLDLESAGAGNAAFRHERLRQGRAQLRSGYAVGLDHRDVGGDRV